MTIKLKTPPMPEPDGPWHWKHIGTGESGLYEEDPRQFGIDPEHPEYKWVRLHSAAQLAARDAQWLGLVGPVVEAAERGLEYVEAELQQRKELYEPYGLEGKWATEQRDADAIRAALRAITEEQE